MTYVGNAPNFAVKAIAEHSGLKMPSFFGYMGYSLAVLHPYIPDRDRRLLPLRISAATVRSSAQTISSIPAPSMPPGRSPRGYPRRGDADDRREQHAQPGGAGR